MGTDSNRFKRLKWQIVLINMGFVISLLLALLIAIYALMNRQMDVQSMDVLSRVIKQETSDIYEPVTEEEGIKIPYFTIELRTDGRAAFIDGQYNTAESLARIQTMMKIVLDKSEKTGWVEGYPFRYMKVTDDHITRISFVDCSYENSLRASLLGSIISMGIIVMIVFALLSYFFAGWVVKPIEDTWRRQKQFLADASHELKTPLTVILANAELLIRACPRQQVVERRWLGNIYEESRNMKTLILEMLTLAKKDAVEKKTILFEKIDLMEILQTTLLQFEPLFYQNNRFLQDYLPDESIRVEGNAESLMQVFRILLDNAIKYSPFDSITRINVFKMSQNKYLDKLYQLLHRRPDRRNHQKIELVISNEGIQMTPEQCKDIFKRFYRLDEARSEEHGNGYGLGLSIAAEIMREHHGKIWATSSEGWNHFHLQFTICKE